jgi:hypothetical protein
MNESLSAYKSTKTDQKKSKENVTIAYPRQQPLPAAHIPEPYGMAALLLNLQRTHGNRYVQRLLEGIKRPYIQRACSPTPVTYDKILAIPETTPGTLGYTKPDKLEFELNPDFKDGTCKVKLSKEGKLAFKHFVYTKEGTYRIGTAKAGEGPCKDKEIDAYLKITEKMAVRIKQGEIEHCEDANRAFDLSYGRYNKAAKELEKGFAAKDEATCNTEIVKRLVAKVGIDIAQWKSVADCLFDKTSERDRTWHQVSLGTPTFSKDCKSVTFTPDATTNLTEVGKHTPKEIVKGCGEK